jgi:protein ImuB
MRLWIALHLPLLPLETFRARWSSPGLHVVLERDHVLSMTSQAQAAGVRCGMRKGGVLAMAPDVILHERDLALEQAALNSVALTMLQYTPEVALADDHGVLLDVTASLRAFNGHLSLCRRVRASVTALGFTAQIGMAPTAQGAWLLASYPCSKLLTRRRMIRIDRMTHWLDKLGCTLLPAARPYHAWLEGIGCHTLGDLRKLPRAGLQRRTSREVMEELDRAYGAAPELFEWVQAPHIFAVTLELPERVEQAQAVLFAAQRLLLQMAGWLVSRQLAVTEFILYLQHERGRTAVAPTPVEIGLAEAAWHEEHLIRLVRERLARMALCAPVIGLQLEATKLVNMMPPTPSLFPEPGGTRADYHRLLDLLSARLGSDSVLAPAPVADYRPEASNRWVPAASYRTMAFKPLPAERPFWLLEKPIALLVREHRPFYGSALQLIRGPERIECGWWDSGFAVRDYFVAQDRDAACYWIYRERSDEQWRWFLHGLFA